MEIKKNPKSNLENYSKLFMQLGLVLALFITYVAIEKKTYDRQFNDLGIANMNAELEEEIPITEQIRTPPPPPPPPPAPEVIEIVEDEVEVEETIIDTTEADQETEIVEVEDVVVEDVVEDVDVPLSVIENVPVFPGCEKGNNNDKKKCMNEKIKKFVTKKFNVDLAQDLGLPPGNKKISVFFKIDKNGNIVDVKSRAPHPRLEKEAKRVIGYLPKMTPGKQGDKSVGVIYSQPITFQVED